MDKKHDHHWERFEAHTRLKHAILRAYLGAWGRILLLNGPHQTIWFVDGFAGRGRDSEGTPGSPLIACAIARELEQQLREKDLQKEFRIALIEADKDNFALLQESVRESACSPLVFHNTINAQYSDVLALIGNAPALFFLDPWGVEGLSSEMIANMLHGERREVLLLFSEEGTHRLARAAAAEPAVADPNPALSLFDDEPSTHANKLVSYAYREADEAILQDVFMGIWDLVEETASNARGNERASYLSSYMAIQELLGATYVLPMAIIDENDHHHYSLVHASKSGKAIVAMKDALYSAMNKRAAEIGLLGNFHFASPGLSRVCDQLVDHFAGKTVRWQNKPEKGTVKLYALEETWALVSDLPEIKKILCERGYESAKRPQTFTFPSRSGDRRPSE
jgi:three-Cys-motif partner protein